LLAYYWRNIIVAVLQKFNAPLAVYAANARQKEELFAGMFREPLERQR
jgi:hypothetical protein